MDREEVNLCWVAQRDRSSFHDLPRWAKWRVTKKFAKWSGKPRQVSVPLFWGQEMTIVYPEYVSGRLGRYGFFEKDVTSIFIDCLEPGMTFYDVGSHFGYFSLLASTLVGPEGQVFAFEPTANTFQVLSENAARRDNITCNQVAAYRESGHLTFLDQGLGDSSLNFIVGDQWEGGETKAGTREIQVPAIKLDDFAQQHGDPDFLKIDTEGAEVPVLQGMANVIQRCHPTIVLELGDPVCERTGNEPSRQNVVLLQDYGYEVFEYQNFRCQPHKVKNSYPYTNLLFRHPSRIHRGRVAA